MKEQVYIETTIISYLAARPSKTPLHRSHQEVTRRWWRTRASHFSLFTSQFVIDEASAGDPRMASARLSYLDTMRFLEIGQDAPLLAEALLGAGALPPKARLDALHLAVVATNRIRFLLTWNCKHLANALRWPKIEQVCVAHGHEPPRICTPLELMGGAS